MRNKRDNYLLSSEIQTGLGKLVTEQQNQETKDIGRKSTAAILELMNKNDKQVACAVTGELPSIVKAVKMIIARLKNGGRLFYIGAGTSGRLGVVDAAECPPTFGTDPEMVQGIIAGGNKALVTALEGCEDKEWMGARDLMRRKLTRKDVVVGLSTSGRTPYVAGALKRARSVGAKTVAIAFNPGALLCQYADVVINPIVGPEIIMGSTRLKAGTAEKMILNMISTTSMIKLGRVRGNLMSDMKVSCGKLQDRAKRVVIMSTGTEAKAAEDALIKSNWEVKRAIELLRKNSKRPLSGKIRKNKS